MNRIKEKIKAIWAIIKGGQYAVFVINNGYLNAETTPNKATCLISDNTTDYFLEAIVEFVQNYIKDNK